MKRTATLNSFLKGLSSKLGIEQGRLYQLVQSAETSYYLRNTQRQLEIGLTLQHFPYPFDQVGKYYEAVYLYRNNQYEKARIILENVAEYAPSRYRSKALLSLSAVEETLGNFEEALRLRAASCSLDDPLTFIEAQRGIAVLRSFEGSHDHAIKHLESLLPIVRIASKAVPMIYPMHLNSLAIELSEVGRMEEAKQVSNILLASPYFDCFPEVGETVREILLKSQPASRQILSFKEPTNILILPLSENPVIQSPPTEPARILSYAKWKKKMGKKPNGNDKKLPEHMTSRDMVIRIMNLTTQEGISDDKLQKIIDYVEKILSEPD